jgi:hypothetical protein
MPLSAADLEWIRRLPAQPSAEDQGTLRVLRRGVVAPDERRLLDSLLAPLAQTTADELERAELDRRLAVIDEALSDEDQEHVRTAVRRGALRIAEHKARAARRNPLQSDQDAAVEAAMAGHKERRRSLERERVQIQERLRELRPSGRWNRAAS